MLDSDMTEAEIFNRGITRLRLGGPVQLPPESRAGKGYEHIRRVAKTLIGSARQQLPQLPNIHFGFVSDGNVNAFAFKSDDRYFIGLTTGTVFMLELVIMRMLSNGQLFPDVGNPGDEAENLPPLSSYLAKAEEMFKQGHISAPPKSQSRHAYAVFLLDHALRFLVGHEIAHVTLGHVDYMDSKTGAGLIAELGWNESDASGVIERQCLEAQADTRSVFSTIASLKLTHEALVKPAWLDSPWNESQLIFDWAFAMNSLFRVFGDVRFDSSQLATNSYPPLPIRRAMATATAYAAVMGSWNSALKDKTLLALRTATKYTEYAFATILGEKVAMEGLADAYSPLGQEHYRRLRDRFPELQERLVPFAYEGLLSIPLASP